MDKIITFQFLHEKIIEYCRENNIVRNNPIDTNPWLVFLVGEKEDKEIDYCVCESQITKEAVQRKYVPPSNLRELLAEHRILVKRINKKSYLKLTRSI